MSIQILDCTIRDGGYLTGKKFTPEFVNGVINGLIKAGIDYIEVGFLQNQKKDETIVYSNSQDARKYIPFSKGVSQFTGFADNSRYSIDKLDDFDGKSFENIRICFAKHEYKEALRFADAAKKKGYHLFVQPMDAMGYTWGERDDLLSRVNDIMPDVVSIVDTFGSMYLEDMKAVFEQMDGKLDRTIKIGCHSHNNLQLSCALTEKFIALAVQTGRNIVVDSSLLGMGRGAGNAPTEAIVNYLNVMHGKKYNLTAIFDVIDQYVEPLKKIVYWGYDLPMFISGATSSHVDNIYYLQNNENCSSSELYQVLESMDIEKRKRYDFQYSKNDFTEVKKAYDNLKREGNKQK